MLVLLALHQMAGMNVSKKINIYIFKIHEFKILLCNMYFNVSA